MMKFFVMSIFLLGVTAQNLDNFNTENYLKLKTRRIWHRIQTTGDCIKKCSPLDEKLSWAEYSPHDDCDLYCMCIISGHQVVKRCPKNKHYSESLNQCVDPEIAQCANKFKGCLGNCTLSHDGTIEENLLAHENCDEYCKCKPNGRLEMHKCAPGLYFSLENGSCVGPEDAKCKSTAEENVSNEIKDKQEQDIGGCLEQCPETNSHDYTVMFPHSNCSYFCECNWGKHIVIECPDSLHFNNQTKICDLPSNAHCTGNNVNNKLNFNEDNNESNSNEESNDVNYESNSNGESSDVNNELNSNQENSAVTESTSNEKSNNLDDESSSNEESSIVNNKSSSSEDNSAITESISNEENSAATESTSNEESSIVSNESGSLEDNSATTESISNEESSDKSNESNSNEKTSNLNNESNSNDENSAATESTSNEESNHINNKSKSSGANSNEEAHNNEDIELNTETTEPISNEDSNIVKNESNSGATDPAAHNVSDESNSAEEHTEAAETNSSENNESKAAEEKNELDVTKNNESNQSNDNDENSTEETNANNEDTSLSVDKQNNIDEGCIGSCPASDSSPVFYLLHRDCRKYCECVNGYPVAKNCSAGLYFDEIIRQCVISKFPKCGNTDEDSAQSITENKSASENQGVVFQSNGTGTRNSGDFLPSDAEEENNKINEEELLNKIKI